MFMIFLISVRFVCNMPNQGMEKDAYMMSRRMGISFARNRFSN